MTTLKINFSYTSTLYNTVLCAGSVATGSLHASFKLQVVSFFLNFLNPNPTAINTDQYGSQKAEVITNLIHARLCNLKLNNLSSFCPCTALRPPRAHKFRTNLTEFWKPHDPGVEVSWRRMSGNPHRRRSQFRVWWINGAFVSFYGAVSIVSLIWEWMPGDRFLRRLWQRDWCATCKMFPKHLLHSPLFAFNPKRDENPRDVPCCDERDVADEGSINQKTKTKRVRTTFSEEQIQYLTQQFNIDSNPDGQELERIALRTGLTKRVTQARKLWHIMRYTTFLLDSMICAICSVLAVFRFGFKTRALVRKRATRTWRHRSHQYDLHQLTQTPLHTCRAHRHRRQTLCVTLSLIWRHSATWT